MSNDEEKKVPGSEEETPEVEESVEEAAAEEEAVAEPEGEPTPPPAEKQDKVMDDVKAFLSSDDSPGPVVADFGEEYGEDLDDLMTTKRSNISLIMFLIGLVIILGVVGYVLVNEEAKTKVAAFIRGDLFKLEKQRAEDPPRVLPPGCQGPHLPDHVPLRRHQRQVVGGVGQSW